MSVARDSTSGAAIRGRAKTASASKYLQQLCKHWSHKFEVEFSKTRGQVRFPSAVATLEASAEALFVALETDDPGSVERLKETLARHLDRFAFREAPLPFEWSATSPSPTDNIVQETTMPSQAAQAVRRAWRNVLPAAAPGCSQGTPYSFWVKEGNPKKLAVIFAGGGACWTGENCALHCRPHYRAFAGLELDPTGLGGVFDTDNAENPLADYTLVYLPTANGDLFLGDAAPVYDTPAMNGHPEGKLTILHKGFDNAMLALDWMFKTYPRPETVAVMGWSAGALASPLYTHIVARHCPDALVTHFADGGGAYHLGEKLAPLFRSWGTANVLKRVDGFETVPIEGLTVEDLYIRAAELNPDIVFHQYNERHDAVQAMFMQLIGEAKPDVPAKLDQAHAYIRARVSNFRTYTSWGCDEAIIGGYYDAVLALNALDNRGHPHVLDRFYTRQTDGVRFLDWFAAAVTGKRVEDVACKDSRTPEHHWTRPAFSSQAGA